MFDFFPVGVGIALIGIAFLFVGWRLIPIRNQGQHEADMPFRVGDYVSEATLSENSPLVGKAVTDLEALSEGTVSGVAIIRGGMRRNAPGSRWRLTANDVLILESDPHDLHSLVTSASLLLIGPKENETAGKQAVETAVAEAVITAGSPMIGVSSTQLELRER